MSIHLPATPHDHRPSPWTTWRAVCGRLVTTSQTAGAPECVTCPECRSTPHDLTRTVWLVAWTPEAGGLVLDARGVELSIDPDYHIHRAGHTARGISRITWASLDDEAGTVERVGDLPTLENP